MTGISLRSVDRGLPAPTGCPAPAWHPRGRDPASIPLPPPRAPTAWPPPLAGHDEPAARGAHAGSVRLVDVARFVVGLFGLVVVLAGVWLTICATIVPLAFGWTPVAITSGSMEPRIGTGDLVIVVPYDGHELGPGTVIVFETGTSAGLVTHRIVRMDESGDYITRGDANRDEDSTPVAPDRIVGVGRILIPLVGTPAVWFEHGRPLELAALAGLALSALWAARWGLFSEYDPWATTRRAGRRRSSRRGRSVAGDR